MPRLRILVAHNVLNTRTGGMSRMLGFIHDRIAALGHQVDYFCAEDVPVRLNGRWGRFSFPWLLWRRAVNAAKQDRPYDIINVHEPSAAVLVLGKKSAGNPKIVVTSHGVEQRGWQISLEECRLGRERLSLKSRLLYPLTGLSQCRLGLQRADHVFCLSDEDREYLQRWLHLPGDRVTRLCPAATPIYGTAAPQRDYSSAERLLFFGTWLKRKGTADLVEAFTVLAGRHPRLELLVLGGGLPVSAIRASFPGPLQGRVSCASNLTEAELAAQLATTDIFVLPSLFEGTPQTLVEAMLSGLPIVTTETCGMRDVIRHDHNGLLVPTRSPEALVAAVERLKSDPALRKRLGQQAHADAALHYTWEQVSSPVRQVYESLSET